MLQLICVRLLALRGKKHPTRMPQAGLVWPALAVALNLQIDTYPRPSQPLQLYEFEGCPFCKKVRSVVTAQRWLGRALKHQSAPHACRLRCQAAAAHTGAPDGWCMPCTACAGPACQLGGPLGPGAHARRRRWCDASSFQAPTLPCLLANAHAHPISCVWLCYAWVRRCVRR